MHYNSNNLILRCVKNLFVGVCAKVQHTYLIKFSQIRPNNFTDMRNGVRFEKNGAKVCYPYMNEVCAPCRG